MSTTQLFFIIVVIFLTAVSENQAEIHRIQKRQTLNICFNATIDTIFYLFTRNNEDTPDIINLNDAPSLAASNFNKSNPTRFIVHGFLNDVNSDVNVVLRAAYLKKGDFNLISVDWSKASLNVIYPYAQVRTKDVSEVLAPFVNFLCENGDISISSVYLIGHSLGAHICGMAAKILKSVYGKKVPTIFGLDPALPDYYIACPKFRLDPTDADYVETVQSNCGEFGFVTPLGQASFYPNYGGPYQIGCTTIPPGCSHGRSFQYLAESINSDIGFVGHKCANYQEITILKKCTISGNDELIGGEPSRPGRTGVFYFPTNGESPFAVGQFS